MQVWYLIRGRGHCREVGSFPIFWVEHLKSQDSSVREVLQRRLKTQKTWEHARRVTQDRARLEGASEPCSSMALESCFSSSEACFGFIPLICTLYSFAALGSPILKDKRNQTQSVHFIGVQLNSICVVAGESRGMCTNLSCFCDGAGVNTVQSATRDRGQSDWLGLNRARAPWTRGPWLVKLKAWKASRQWPSGPAPRQAPLFGVKRLKRALGRPWTVGPNNIAHFNQCLKLKDTCTDVPETFWGNHNHSIFWNVLFLNHLFCAKSGFTPAEARTHNCCQSSAGSDVTSAVGAFVTIRSCSGPILIMESSRKMWVSSRIHGIFVL